MPTYDYRCQGCEAKFEKFNSVEKRDQAECPKCGSGQVVRLITGGNYLKGGSCYTSKECSNTCCGGACSH